jgi:regulator of replication initiation timing
MAKAAVATRSTELESIDRLEEKVKLLVGVLERMKTDTARLNDENSRLKADMSRANEENTRMRADLEAAKTRLGDAEGSRAELTALRDEREQIRTRVADMLNQIEALNL